MDSNQRREFTGMLGAVAAAKGVAGCSGVGDLIGDDAGTDTEEGDTAGDGDGDVGGGRATTDDAMNIESKEGGNQTFQFTNDIYQGAKAVVQSLSGDPEESPDATAALVYPSADDVDTGELEALVTAEANSSDVAQAEARVVMEASYSQDVGPGGA